VRVRLRPAYSPEELAELYAVPHDHTRWQDHLLRVDMTVQVTRFMYKGGRVADLSCGSAAIPLAVTPDPILGDIAPGYQYHGPIEQTIDSLQNVQLFICCETLEHLDDPDMVLRKIRAKTDTLVLSTPLGEFTDHNPEHYWGWDGMSLQWMVQDAGFTPVVQTALRFPEINVMFAIWGCR
jgi:hypothetical protein